MAGFSGLISALRRAEKQLERQLHGIRVAISSLEMGSAVSPSLPEASAALKGTASRQRQLSPAARKAISEAQKRRWAKHKADKKT